MEVQIQRSTIVHRDNSSSSSSAVEPYEALLTIFDLLNPNYYCPFLLAFTPPTPSNSDIIAALTRTLVHLPRLVSQLGYDNMDRPCFYIGGEGADGGALVVEATVGSDLADHLPLQPSRDFRLLHPPGEASPAHLLQVQINRFRCGGLVLGVTTHHRACDGQSMAAFYVAWGQAVRGVPIEPIPVDEVSWLTSRVSDKSGFRHWKLDFVPAPPEEAGFDSGKDCAVDWNNISNVLVHYPWEFINAKLKPLLKGKKHSTFEVLMAHIWRKTTAARRLSGDEYTMLRISIDGRRRLEPAIPYKFIGNLVLSGYCKSTAGALLSEGGLGLAAKLIHEAIVRTDGRYFQSIMDRPANEWKEEEAVEHVNDVSPAVAAAPILDANSLLGLRFEEVDFGGGGRLCGLLPGWVPIEGIVQVLPSLREDGGIDVFVTLLEEDAERFREISHSLD